MPTTRLRHRVPRILELLYEVPPNAQRVSESLTGDLLPIEIPPTLDALKYRVLNA
jgi:hypothetical protein